MTDDDRYRLIGQLQRREDADHAVHRTKRFYPFKDTAGKWTIGWGRNIEERGISQEEADVLLANDMEAIESDLDRTFPWFAALDSVRQCAMVHLGMIGLTKLLGFEKALRAMAAGEYALAAEEFYDSNLPKPNQWGVERTSEVCAQIRTGEWQ